MRESPLIFESFGVIASVSCDSARVLGEITKTLPPGWQPSEAEPEVRFELARDGAVRRDGAEWHHPELQRREPVLRLAALVRHSLAELAPRHAFIHAGVVEVAGGAVVIPGRSRSGKTTLVRALLEAGARYCSDEYAVVDDAGWIHPYPKALTVRVDGGTRVGVPVDVPKERVVMQPLRTRLVVVTSFVDGSHWEPVEVSAAEGSLALLENTVGARPRPSQSLAATSALTRGAHVLSGPRGESVEAARGVLDWLDGRESLPQA